MCMNAAICNVYKQVIFWSIFVPNYMHPVHCISWLIEYDYTIYLNTIIATLITFIFITLIIFFKKTEALFLSFQKQP